MKTQLISKTDPNTKKLLERFLTAGGFKLVDQSPELVVHYFSAAEELNKLDSKIPRLILGEGIFDILGNIDDLNLQGVLPHHEIRMRAQSFNSRLNEDIYIHDKLARIEVKNANVKVAATANYQLSDYPVAIFLPEKNLFILTISNLDNLKVSELIRFIKIWICQELIAREKKPIKVGLLAYGAIGHEHNRAVSNVSGFELVAVCDSNPARIEEAKSLAGNIDGYLEATEMLNSDIDLVVISTPPNSHYSWAKQALEKNKHVVLEKPMALTTSECDELIALANERNKTLVVYQNRRWDQDFLSIKNIFDKKMIGEVFHAEIFVGGYGHPCNYWHSDQEISGGAIFDWGSHFLDQALAIFGSDVKYVTAKEHKINWLDVTNSDHARITLHYKNGLEVEFIHSDLAAALKPKYYFLGTNGAIVGEWRHEKIISRNEIGTLREDILAPADSPAEIKFFDKEGSVTHIKTKNPQKYQFHRELADWIFDDIPMSVNALTSRNVVAVMQAAARSAAGGGLPVAPLL